MSKLNSFEHSRKGSGNERDIENEREGKGREGESNYANIHPPDLGDMWSRLFSFFFLIGTTHCMCITLRPIASRHERTWFRDG